jgi:NADPH-dependent 2,4-dienoyl-CoA reductase/sulfur reductase-like enzyme
VRLVIIGGSDAGISAALRAREVDPSAEVIVVVADRFPNYSICGLPFYLSGEVPDWRRLAHRTLDEIEGQGVRLLLEQRAELVDPRLKRVGLTDGAGREEDLAYDRLIIATGAEPRRPSITGLDLPGVFVLHTMEDSFAIEEHLARHDVRRAVIIGGGYIGVEMADALTHRDMHVTLLQQGPSLLRTVDPALAAEIATELQRHGVAVATEVRVGSIERDGSSLLVGAPGGFQGRADLVLVAAGVQPASALAREAGIAVGERGAIRVNRAMETNVADISAAGDCVETWHRLLVRPTYLPLGTTAHKQGRVAGENAVGGRRLFEGSLGTQVVKVFDLAIAGTGLTEAAARQEGFVPVVADVRVPHHKAYYPGAHELRIRVVGDGRTGRLLGMQIVGHWQAEVAKRIDVATTALYHGMLVDGLSDLDLSYTPPVSSPWDPVQMAAQAWGRLYAETSMLPWSPDRPQRA